MTIDDFKRGIRELNLWSSSSMLAFEGDQPIAVLLAAKRDHANLVHRIAVRPGHERRGHGRHLLGSLGKKLAILGPPRLVAEVPAEWEEVRRFFESSGFQAEAHYADFVLEAERKPTDTGGLVSEVTLEDLLESGAFDSSLPRSWERSLLTLQNRKSQIEGLAVASDVRIEAYLLHRLDPDTGTREIVALGAQPGERGEALLRLLVSSLYERRSELVRVPKVSEAEVGFSRLEELGFRRQREYVGYTAAAIAN